MKDFLDREGVFLYALRREVGRNTFPYTVDLQTLKFLYALRREVRRNSIAINDAALYLGQLGFYTPFGVRFVGTLPVLCAC